MTGDAPLPARGDPPGRRVSGRVRAWGIAIGVVVAILGTTGVAALVLQTLGRRSDPLPWPPPVRAGVEIVAIPSAALGRDMGALVWTPEATPPPGGYPVVVLLHGQGGDASVWFHAIGADHIAADLITDGTIPPVLLVSANTDDSMGVDSPPSDDGWAHGLYGTYLADELLPAIAARFPISDDPRDRSIAGLSMGGYAALHHAFRHPDRFGGAGGLSPAVALDIQPVRAWLYRDEPDRDARDPQRLALTADLQDTRVFLGAGAGDYDWIIEGTRVMAEALGARGVPVTLADAPPTGHDGETWRALTPGMLEWLLVGPSRTSPAEGDLTTPTPKTTDLAPGASGG